MPIKKIEKSKAQKAFELMQDPEAKRKDTEKKKKKKKEKEAKEKNKQSLNRFNLRDQKKPSKMGNPAVVKTYEDARENAMINRNIPKLKKGASIPGSYIPDDHPDIEKRHKARVKGKKFNDKINKLISPFLTKKFKKQLEKEDKPIKKSTTKYIEDAYIRLKSKKRTASEGSFSKGGVARGTGAAIRGKGFKGIF